MSEPMPFAEAGVLKRHPDNPLLTRADAPYPCSLLLEESGEVKIYYGAADTVECLATAHVDDLLALVGAN